MSTLSTHILDISTGRPAEGVTVSLSREGETLVTLVTNAQGRIATFSSAPLPAGRYCLTAETGAWFARAGRESVFTRAQIDFVIGEAAEDHFHLPFLKFEILFHEIHSSYNTLVTSFPSLLCCCNDILFLST